MLDNVLVVWMLDTTLIVLLLRGELVVVDGIGFFKTILFAIRLTVATLTDFLNGFKLSR